MSLSAAFSLLILQTASERGRDNVTFAATQRHDTSSEPGWLRFDISQILGLTTVILLPKRIDMSDRDRVTGVALSLSKIYLGCRDAFPTPQMKADWGETVWREACVTTGTNLESFIPFELVRPIPTATLRVPHYFVSVCRR